jgi:hypothetical protein
VNSSGDTNQYGGSVKNFAGNSKPGISSVFVCFQSGNTRASLPQRAANDNFRHRPATDFPKRARIIPSRNNIPIAQEMTAAKQWIERRK